MGTLIAAAFVVLVTACARDINTSLTAPARSTTTISTSITSPATEIAAITALTRTLAMSLRNPAVRHQLELDLRDVGQGKEAKLEARKYLRGTRGGALVASISKESGISRDSILVLFATVRPLEIYLPVPGHRRKWRGESVVVAAQIGKRDSLIAFDEGGSPVALSAKTPPAEPVIALIPVETRFANLPHDPAAMPSSKLSATEAVRIRVDDPCSSDIYDVLPPECYVSSGPLPARIPATAPTGLYMVYSELFDAMEPWIRGNPEVEVHVLGPDMNAFDMPSTARSVSCASESGVGNTYFDQNGNEWGGYVQLLSEAQIATHHYAAGSADPRSFSVGLWEDDAGRCVIEDVEGDWNPPMIALLLGSGVGMVAEWGSGGFVVCAAVFTYLVYALAQNDDDFLGVAVPKQNAPGYTNRNANLALQRDAQGLLNGGITLVEHHYGTADY